ncbi:MAG: hypothetical protein HYX92_14095 [Chloroflexi bacterium]|nr:hypothetical protein [Chloroflexota bacterium]
MFSRQKILRYIESKRLSDGGYFFAGIEPSSAADTFYAVKTLRLLGARPRDPHGIVSFFRNSDTVINDIGGLFYAVETIKGIGRHITWLREYGEILEKRKNASGGFGTIGEVYVEVTSELQITYQAVAAAQDLRIPLDGQRVRHFILSFRSQDGGFGEGNLSLLPTTYYALAVLHRLNMVGDARDASHYLRRRETDISASFLEDLFWLAKSLLFLREAPKVPEEWVAFLQDCWRGNGGFCRSRNMGISTFEDTYYAVSVLKLMERTGLGIFEDGQ